MPPVGRHPRRRSGIRGLRRRTNVQPVGGRPRRPRRPPGRPAASPPRRRRPRRGRSAGCGRRRPSTTVRPVRRGGIPKGSRSPWTTSTGTATASSSSSRLGAGARPARRLQREREAEDAGRARRRGRAAGDARARGAPAATQRRPPSAAGAQVLDDRGPGGVELRRRARRAAPRDAVGLLDERHGHPGGLRGRRRGDQVRAATPPPAPWPSTSHAVAPGTACTWARAGPDGVSISTGVKRGGPGRGSRARGRRRRAPGPR